MLQATDDVLLLVVIYARNKWQQVNLCSKRTMQLKIVFTIQQAGKQIV